MQPGTEIATYLNDSAKRKKKAKDGELSTAIVPVFQQISMF